jgi:hypothetical protein
MRPAKFADLNQAYQKIVAYRLLDDEGGSWHIASAGAAHRHVGFSGLAIMS